jgi:hypothetical protein
MHKGNQWVEHSNQPRGAVIVAVGSAQEVCLIAAGLASQSSHFSRSTVYQRVLPAKPIHM